MTDMQLLQETERIIPDVAKITPLFSVSSDRLQNISDRIQMAFGNGENKEEMQKVQQIHALLGQVRSELTRAEQNLSSIEGEVRDYIGRLRS